MDTANAQIQAGLELGPEMPNQDREDCESAKRIQLVEMAARALAQGAERDNRAGLLLRVCRIKGGGAHSDLP